MAPRTDAPDHPMAWWADGWSRSREAGRPQWQGDVGRIEVGAARESVRWLLPRPDASVLRDLLDRPHPRDTAVKVFGDPAVWESHFPVGWVADILVVLMTHRFVEVPVDVPPSNRLEVDDEVHRVVVRVLAEDGALAASGQLGVGAVHVVPDRIVTQDAHRRRGLGSVVMAALGSAAVARGHHDGVLGATRDGEALYRRLGCVTVGPRTGMYLRPDDLSR